MITLGGFILIGFAAMFFMIYLIYRKEIKPREGKKSQTKNKN
jgi:hypothetical protein